MTAKPHPNGLPAVTRHLVTFVLLSHRRFAEAVRRQP